jgi:hypothetical protein
MQKVLKSQVTYLTVVAIMALTMILAGVIYRNTVSAAALSNVLVRFDRMKVSAPTTGTVCAKPATVSTEADVQVDFPAGYTVSTTLGDWTVNTSNLAWPAGASAWPGINTALPLLARRLLFLAQI